MFGRVVQLASFLWLTAEGWESCVDTRATDWQEHPPSIFPDSGSDAVALKPRSVPEVGDLQGRGLVRDVEQDVLRLEVAVQQRLHVEHLSGANGKPGRETSQCAEKFPRKRNLAAYGG